MRHRSLLLVLLAALFVPFEGASRRLAADDSPRRPATTSGPRCRRQFLDAFVLDAAGVRPVSNHRAKKRLGLADVQEFPVP